MRASHAACLVAALLSPSHVPVAAQTTTDRRLGLFFFNPAAGYAECFSFPGDWSRKYMYNPYLTSPLNLKHGERGRPIRREE